MKVVEIGRDGDGDPALDEASSSVVRREGRSALYTSRRKEKKGEHAPVASTLLAGINAGRPIPLKLAKSVFFSLLDDDEGSVLVAGKKGEKDVESVWCKSTGRGLVSQCRERLPLVHRDKGEPLVVRLSVASKVEVEQIVLANELSRVNEGWPIVVGRVESPQQPHLSQKRGCRVSYSLRCSCGSNR